MRPMTLTTSREDMHKTGKYTAITVPKDMHF